MRDLANLMLAILDRSSRCIDGDNRKFQARIGEVTVDFDVSSATIDLAFERLSSVIESAVAEQRVREMIDAAGATKLPPLWIVSGPDVLARWLRWAGASKALQKVLSLTGEPGLAPVSGYLDRRARRELGQGGARIRVRGGMAVAERIELSDRPRGIAILGETNRIRVERHRLPETVIVRLQHPPEGNAHRPLDEVVSHPFFAAADLGFTGLARNEGGAVEFEVEGGWAPLERVPAIALAVLPADADPAFPWRMTVSERRRLDGFVEEARHRAAAMAGPRL